MLCSVPTHVSVKCQEVGLNMFKHNFYVSKGKKSERGNKGCKITIAHEVSILEFRIKDYTWSGELCNWLPCFQRFWKKALVSVAVWWLTGMLRSFRQFYVPESMFHPPPTISCWWTILTLFNSPFFFCLHPVVFNWQHVIQSQCCQFFLLQWCVCWSNLFWPALRSLWKEESLSHR